MKELLNSQGVVIICMIVKKQIRRIVLRLKTKVYSLCASLFDLPYYFDGRGLCTVRIICRRGLVMCELTVWSCSVSVLYIEILN